MWAMSGLLFGLFLLAGSVGLMLVGVKKSSFGLVDQVVVLLSVISGVLLIWAAYRSGRVNRRERRRMREYRRIGKLRSAQLGNAEKSRDA